MKRPLGYWLLSIHDFSYSLQTITWNALGQEKTVLVQRGKTRRMGWIIVYSDRKLLVISK
jgi:hypothetical protein